MRLLLCISLIAMIKAMSYLDEVPKDINELFPKGNSTNASLDKSGAYFDIEKIDINKLMEKIGSTNNSFNDGEDARKRGIPLIAAKLSDSAYRDRYTDAADILEKQKLCDMMLQVIYMSRHGVRRLESSPLFNKHDIGFRIGILYSKLRKIYRKMRDVYQTMINSADDNYFAGHATALLNRNLHREDRYLIMHHRLVKMHTDFLYIFWVLIKIDGMFMDSNKVPIKQPISNISGISIENQEIG